MKKKIKKNKKLITIILFGKQYFLYFRDRNKK